MSDLDESVAKALREAYETEVSETLWKSKHGYWKFCTVCLKMQNHREQKIAGIMEYVCEICGTPKPPVEKPVFRLVKRPKP